MVKERINRRELILETAAKLFAQQGYTKTSVRQIADEVGVTEAALYYHFKEGKRELLQNVIEGHFPKLNAIVEKCRSAQSLHELVLLYGKHMREVGPSGIQKMRWLSAEFPHLTAEEQMFIQEKQIKFHNGMATLLQQFVKDTDEANNLAWILLLTGFGYGQLLINFNLQARADFSPDAVLETLARLVVACQ